MSEEEAKESGEVWCPLYDDDTNPTCDEMLTKVRRFIVRQYAVSPIIDFKRYEAPRRFGRGGAVYAWRKP